MIKMSVFNKTNDVLIVDTSEQHVDFLMKMALTKIAFLPFSLITDKWRFDVFRGDVTPSNYGRHWWQLRYRDDNHVIIIIIINNNNQRQC